jgi:enoyl-CoA hydratase/carnithine racemase
MSTTDVPSATKAAQVRLNRVTPSHCRVVLDNPPLNLMGPEFVLQIREIVTALENDDRVKVVVFESAVDGFFLNHSDFLAKFEDLTSIPQGPTGLEAWPDVLVRLTRAPFVSIALIRGRATGNGSELALACDMSFASREKALLSQWEVGVGLVAGGGPMARLPRVMGRGRALEVLLTADDIRGADAELLGYVNRALPDAELDNFVDTLATRIASFDKWAIANTKRLVNEASLPPDVEIRAGWDACMASVKRPATQERIKALLEQGLQKPGDSENRLGFYVGQLGLGGGPATEPERTLSRFGRSRMFAWPREVALLPARRAGQGGPRSGGRLADAGMDRVAAAWSTAWGCGRRGCYGVIRRECRTSLGELRLLACPPMSVSAMLTLAPGCSPRLRPAVAALRLPLRTVAQGPTCCAQVAPDRCADQRMTMPSEMTPDRADLRVVAAELTGANACIPSRQSPAHALRKGCDRANEWVMRHGCG